MLRKGRGAAIETKDGTASSAVALSVLRDSVGAEASGSTAGVLLGPLSAASVAVGQHGLTAAAKPARLVTGSFFTSSASDAGAVMIPTMREAPVFGGGPSVVAVPLRQAATNALQPTG